MVDLALIKSAQLSKSKRAHYTDCLFLFAGQPHSVFV